MSRAVSADFVACECLFFGCICRRSARSVKTDFFGLASCWTVCFVLVSCKCSSTCYRVTNSSARSVRSFFSACDRASTRPFVDARGPFVASALGRDPPDTDKIFSIVLRDSSPLHNRDSAWAKDQVKGTHRAGVEPQGFAHHKAANQHRHKSRSAFSVMGLWMVCLRNLTRRAGQRWEPTPAPRQGSERNEGGPSGSPLFFARAWHSSLSRLR